MAKPISKINIPYTEFGTASGDTTTIEYNFAFGIPEFATLSVYEEGTPSNLLSYEIATEGFLTITNDGTVPAQGTFVVIVDVPADKFVRNVKNGNIFREQTMVDLFTQVFMVAGSVAEGRLSSLAQDLDMGANKVVNMADGIDAQDAVTKAQLDAVTSTTLPILQGLVTDATTQAGISTTNATNTGNDVISTNADVLSTNADVVATNADVLTTNADVLITNADVLSSATNASNASQSALDAQVSKMEWKNTYNAGTAYALNDVVYFAGSSYINIQAGTGEQPDTSPTYWELVALKGADGIDGVDGSDGADGVDGADGAGGAWDIIATADISTQVTNVDFITGFDGTYKAFKLIGSNVATTAPTFSYIGVRTSLDGITFEDSASNNYKFTGHDIYGGTTVTVGNINGSYLTTSYQALQPESVTVGASSTFEYTFGDLSETKEKHGFVKSSYTAQADPTKTRYFHASTLLQKTAPVLGLRVVCAGGTLSNGNITLLGLK